MDDEIENDELLVMSDTLTASEWGDAIWWGYITTTTIGKLELMADDDTRYKSVDKSDMSVQCFFSASGLGDLHLQPEFVFTIDVIRFSLLILTNFVIWSMFLTKLSSYVLQDSRLRALQERLKRASRFHTDDETMESQKDQRKYEEDLDRLVELSKIEKPKLHEIEERELVLQHLLEYSTKERESLEREIEPDS